MAGDAVDRVWCQQCNTPLDESPQTPPDKRLPCPQCGSLSRYLKVVLADTIELHEDFLLKAREPGSRDPYLEELRGASFFRRAQRWVNRFRRIDRRKDQYDEVVTDPATGAVIHECHEPLSKHRGHGSARQRRNT